MSTAPALTLEQLTVRGFRNLEDSTITFGPRFNIIFGDNGAGKSSVIEAIAYLAMLRSFRSAKNDDLVQTGQTQALIAGSLHGAVLPNALRVVLDLEQARVVTLNGKRPRSLSVWHGVVQTVIFHPGDLHLIAGGPDGRRTMLDRVLEQIDPIYAQALGTYEKALRSRNRLLRDEEGDVRAIRAFDDILAASGSIVGLSRERLVQDLAPLAEANFERVVGGEFPCRIRYRHRVPPTVDAIRGALEAAFDKDRARGFTADGPHADDLEFVTKAHLAKHFASQGQQRALVLSLKLAEVEVLAQKTGHLPLLGLDDVSSELDKERNRRLFARIGELGGQVFLTTTHHDFIQLDRDRVDFKVASGNVRRLE